MRHPRERLPSLFAVLQAAITAFFHHLALRAPGGRVPCVGPTRLVRGRRARRAAPRWERCGELGACWGSTARGQRAHGGRRTRKARGGARCEAPGREVGGRKGARRTAQGRTATGHGRKGVGARDHGDQGVRHARREGLTGARERWWDREVVAGNARARAEGGVRTARARGGAGESVGVRTARARGGAGGERSGAAELPG
jgi:hypothetical protein